MRVDDGVREGEYDCEIVCVGVCESVLGLLDWLEDFDCDWLALCVSEAVCDWLRLCVWLELCVRLEVCVWDRVSS